MGEIANGSAVVASTLGHSNATRCSSTPGRSLSQICTPCKMMHQVKGVVLNQTSQMLSSFPIELPSAQDLATISSRPPYGRLRICFIMRLQGSSLLLLVALVACCRSNAVTEPSIQSDGHLRPNRKLVTDGGRFLKKEKAPDVNEERVMSFRQYFGFVPQGLGGGSRITGALKQLLGLPKWVLGRLIGSLSQIGPNRYNSHM